MKPTPWITAVLLGTMTGSASAQPAPPLPPPNAMAAVAPAARPGVYRPISFTASIGPGALVGHGQTRTFADHTQARMGFGLEPDMALYLGFESYGATMVAVGMPETSSSVRHDIWLLGLQYFPLRRIYLRAGLGVGTLEEATAGQVFHRTAGLTLQIASGCELVRFRHAALGLEAGVDSIQYPEESWHGATASATFAVF
jgi:hypothetical protein